jgi:hypothetical protein
VQGALDGGGGFGQLAFAGQAGRLDDLLQE